MPFNMRPYQESDIKAIRGLLRKHRTVLYVLPTGGGKTVVSGFWGQAVVRNGFNVLCLVHRKEILDQFIGTMKAAGLDRHMGVIAPGYPPSPGAPMQIASVFSMIKRRMILSPDMVIVDEAHHVRAATWDRVLNTFPDAKVIGMTASPRRYDGLGLGEHFEVMHMGPTIKELVGQKYLAPVRTKSIPIGFRKVRKNAHGTEYNTKDLSEQVNEMMIAKSADAYIKHALGKAGLFFGISVKHSKAVAQELRDHGIRAVHVDAKTSKYERDKIFRDFRNRQIEVVCNVDLVSEGFDMPDCEVVIDGQPTMSVSRYLQKAGRGMRPYPDDPSREKILIDTAFNYRLHGTCQIDREWSLADDIQDGVRQKDLLKKPMGAALRTCRACAEVFPSTEAVCPACGTEYNVGRKVMEEDIPLVDIAEFKPVTKPKPKPKRTRREIMKMMQTAHAFKAQGDHVAAWNAILNFATESNYSRGWANLMADIVRIENVDRRKERVDKAG